MSKREELIAQAEAMIGVTAWSTEHEQIIEDYNSITPLPQGFKMDCTQPWCATFVSVMAKRAGLTDFPFECSCPRMVSLFANQGKWVEDDAYVPTAGDIIFYDWDDSGSGDCTGTPDHVGIVWSCNGESMNIIEGNISSMVGTRFIPCDAQCVRGFGIPNFEDGNSTAETVSPVVTLNTNEAETAEQTYTVQSGDNWWIIAEKTLGDGTRWDEVMYLNGYTDPNDYIYPGQVFKIPQDDCAECQIDLPSLEDEEASTAQLKKDLEAEVKKLGGEIIWH